LLQVRGELLFVRTGLQPGKPDASGDSGSAVAIVDGCKGRLQGNL